MIAACCFVLGALLGRALWYIPPSKLPTGWEWRPRGDGAVLIDQTATDAVRGWIRRDGRRGWCTSRGDVDGEFRVPMDRAQRHVERELSALGWRDEVKP